MLAAVRPAGTVPMACLPKLKGRLGAPLTDSSMNAGTHRTEFIIQRSFEGLDLKRLKTLLELGFGKRLVEGYFDHPVKEVVLESEYRAVAVIKKLFGLDYLDKLVVAPEAQGNGLARDLWQYIQEESGYLIWRASPANPANSWYQRNSDGTINTGKWFVYWYGMEPRLADCLVPIVAAVPETLIKH